MLVHHRSYTPSIVRGGGTCVISHMAMECVAYNVYVRLLTFNISLHFSVAMVPVVDLLFFSLASSHHLLVISNIVNCYVMEDGNQICCPLRNATDFLPSNYTYTPSHVYLFHAATQCFNFVAGW